ncbi:LOW QUALITY PROTEIN: hypothetical protein RJ639_016457 [Escallonia herrerae]|uniref:Uncharacterized protein n=1 Tax=Escallonia herrerae TaxID=1293975 RepID=A0AA88VEY4_9ASTE|nr:LOW QUALITY PROTEIN: hypothetical protein RJ639_016457 [Escallonia herrerae]
MNQRMLLHLLGQVTTTMVETILRKVLDDDAMIPHFNKPSSMEAGTAVGTEALKEWSEVRAPSETSDRTWTEGSYVRNLTLSQFDAFPLPCPFSVTNCVKWVGSFEGVDGSTYIKAINMFKPILEAEVHGSVPRKKISLGPQRFMPQSISNNGRGILGNGDLSGNSKLFNRGVFNE